MVPTDKNPARDDVSDSTESSSGDESEWLDAEPEQEERAAIVSLVDGKVFTDVKSMLAHCQEAASFDFIGTCKGLGLDFYGAVKLVNYSEIFILFPGQFGIY